MEILIANMVTGEVVGTNTVKGFNGIRGHIREWMSAGLKITDFNVMKWSDYRIWQYLYGYAWEHALSKCDCCNEKKKNSELHFVEDDYEVCLAVVCKSDCMSIDNDWIWEIGTDLKK